MANTVDTELVTDTPKPVKEIPVVQDHGSFKHDTGDIYEGFFEAKKKDKSVKMHGISIYCKRVFYIRELYLIIYLTKFVTE